MDISERTEDAHQSQAIIRHSSRIASRRDFDPERRRVPHTVSVSTSQTVDVDVVMQANVENYEPVVSESSSQTIQLPIANRGDILFAIDNVRTDKYKESTSLIARRPYVHPYPRHDCGPMNLICSHCGAFHWAAECASKSNIAHNEFSSCCQKGKIALPILESPPPVLHDLLTTQTSRAKEFRQNIVLYNRALAFTSVGVKEDHAVNNGRGPPVFRVHGELKHWSGPLNAPSSRSPTYAQLYVYDAKIALQYRMNNNPRLRTDTMFELQNMVTGYNPYSDLYLSAYQILENTEAPDYSLRLCPNPNNRHRDNLSADEVAVILPGSNSLKDDHRDIFLTLQPEVVTPGDDTHSTFNLQRVSEGHPGYCPLHYVLLFPYGEPGWHWNLETPAGKKVTLREHTAFRLHERMDEFSTVLHSGRLLQHYMVDMFAAIDQSRLRWISQHQSELRLSHLQGMEDAVSRSDDAHDLHQIGQRTFLPSSYNGGPRDLHQRYQDSMAIARHFKKIDIFLTMTANPNWPEITRELFPGQRADDRPDLIARVFKQKKDALMRLIKKGKIFGPCVAHVDSIEFQKRGLPHAHILLILDHEHHLDNAQSIDDIIWARWPDPEQHPILFEKVKKFMLHGPCGIHNPSAPCMENGRCRFGFPKEFQERTILTSDGYPLYFRPNDGRAYEVNGFLFDNRWISTFNPFCLETFDCHINIECAYQFWSPKYLFKYLKKGGDMGTIQLANELNEIKKYIEGRYFSAAESAWRIFEYDLHTQNPSVVRLPIHLPDDQSFTFNPNDASDIVVNRGRHVETALTAYFDANRDDSPYRDEARKWSYQQFPEHFTLKKYGETAKRWEPRKQHDALGRMVFVTPTAGERFYLRVLLTATRGATSFESLRTISAEEPPCSTFYDACVQRGLLNDDGEWAVCLEQASEIRSGANLRELFSTLLLFSEVHYPGHLWLDFRHSICDDVPLKLRRLGFVNITESSVYDYGLHLLQDILNESARSLADFPGMPRVTAGWTVLASNRLVAEHLDFNTETERANGNLLISSFNEDQAVGFQKIWESITTGCGGSFFINGPAGSGKTYMYRGICHRVRAESWIILCVASTGLAALLLPHGRTAHSMFKIPISDLDESSICQISKESQRGTLLKRTKAILYDECLMNNKNCFKALDRTLRDIRDCPDKIYGGLTMIHGGDFQQILPVVVKGSRADVVNACLQRSYLWPDMNIINLKRNMRLDLSADENIFARWLIDVGHGRCPLDENGQITLPAGMVTENQDDFLTYLYGDMFPLKNPPPPNFFRDRAILAPRNRNVNETNMDILDRMPGDTISYWSADSQLDESGTTETRHDSLPLEYLHSLEPAGLPPAELKVKLGCPLILLRNLNPLKGLCNGTRLILVRTRSRVLDVRILGTDHDGESALIPRISLVPSTEEGLTFQFKRKQFPVKLAFAMTIHKAEGQSLHNVGLDLREPVFSHGQLYVALSRATSQNRVRVLLNPGSQCKTVNIVYPEVLLD